LKISLPPKVEFILSSLHLRGFEAYIVGGCVRDAILAKKPQDWDITTNARPEQIKRMFRHTIDTGIEHGTVTVLLGKETFEVTTYRIDGPYEDNRHPNSVTFSTSLEEDLARRDFTINAMAYNDEERLQDFVGGMKDLNKHLIRAVGVPMERFSEDALRILRAIRFSAQLGFKLESETALAMEALAGNLTHISAERIQVELVKLLISDHPERLYDAYHLGITKVILPEWDTMVGVEQNTPHHRFDVAEHTMVSVKAIKNDKVLRLTMLMHDMGKPAFRTTDPKGVDHFVGHVEESVAIAKRILRRLKFDNKTIMMVSKLILFHDYRIVPHKKAVRRAMAKISPELFPYYLAVRLADTKAQSDYMQKQKIADIVAVNRLYKEILAEGDAVTIKQLAITGRDLIEAGFEEGPQIGEMLKALLVEVIDKPELNTKGVLLGLAKGVKEGRR